jgi:hypothetical protein
MPLNHILRPSESNLFIWRDSRPQTQKTLQTPNGRAKPKWQIKKHEVVLENPDE